MIKSIPGILSFLFLIALACPSSAQTQPWTKLQSPVNVTLRYLSFVDSLTGWAAGEGGTIIHTTDGGNSWEIQNSIVTTFIMDIFFVDENRGWALTLKDIFPFNSVLLRTTNGGIDWSQENFPDSLGLTRTIFFFDSLNGFSGGSFINYTSDAGDSWITADVDSNVISNFPVYKFNFLNRKFGYACGGRLDVAGVVWRTNNYGLNWTSQGISADEVFDIFVFDSLNAITLSGDPEGLFPVAKLKTTDAGIIWNYSELPFFGLSFEIDFRTYNEGWSASGYKFLLTTNRGETWAEFDTPDSAVVYDLQFTDARNGYAVGEKGVILKLDPNLVDVKDDVANSEDFILYQNYPNPFNPSTNIRFSISDFGFVSLKVYDVLGNEIAILINEEKQPGVYEVEFSSKGGSSSSRNTFSLSSRQADIKDLSSSGIYFYKLIFGEFVQTKKMIYLK